MQERIILTTHGSLGDLHPYIAIAIELQSRGNKVVLATDELYRPRVEGAGIEFYSIRPDSSSLNRQQRREIVRKGMERERGTEYVIRELILPHLKSSYEDLMRAVRGASLLVTHPISFAGPIVAEKTGIPWISSVLSPMSFLSVFDPPVLPTKTYSSFRVLGPYVNQLLFNLGKLRRKHWSDPIRQLRTELGLSTQGDPLFDNPYSPELVLALFSQVFAPPQRDWPKQTRATGFVFYDRYTQSEVAPELLEFLETGEPPIVFTLGSSAVFDAGNFYMESAVAAKQLGYRAILLVGEDERNVPKYLLSDRIVAFNYAPYSLVFPRAAAIVHQGGIGTTAQALKAGKPMLVVPYSHDQFDNAARTEKLGIAKTIEREFYYADRVIYTLQNLLKQQIYTNKAMSIRDSIEKENGVEVACNLIENVIVRSCLATNRRADR